MVAYRNGRMGEIIETLTYEPGLQDSGDMEAATKTISAVAEPGVADYSVALTIPATGDARMTVTRLAIRLEINIDSWGGGGTTLNYRIKRGGTSISTGTLEAAGGDGTKVLTFDLTTGTLTGAATYTIFFWVDAGTCVLSVCELWVGVGSTAQYLSSYQQCEGCLEIAHTGHVGLYSWFDTQNSGNPVSMVSPVVPFDSDYSITYQRDYEITMSHCSTFVEDGVGLGVCSSLSDDIIYLVRLMAILRTEG